MPKSVPPEPWNVSFRRWLGAVIADADAAVADGADPFVTGRRGADAIATAPASAVAGGASARATTGWADGGVGGRRIFSRAAAYTEATTPHRAHLSRSTAGALQRGHVAAITAPAAAPASRRAPSGRAARPAPARQPSARPPGPAHSPSPCAWRCCTSARRRTPRKARTPPDPRPRARGTRTALTPCAPRAELHWPAPGPARPGPRSGPAAAAARPARPRTRP